MKNVTGKLTFTPNLITLSDLVSKYDNKQVTLNGYANIIKSQRPLYDINIIAKNIPLDTTLLNALPESQRAACSRYDTKGKIHFDNVTGRIFADPNTKKLCYRLFLSSDAIEINDTSYAMLPGLMQKTVSAYQPKGKVKVTVDLNKTGDKTTPDYKIHIDFLQNSVNHSLFPYPLKDVTGKLTVTKNTVTLANITATPADNVQLTEEKPLIRIDGQISLARGLLGNGQFDLHANDIILDDRLTLALPAAFGRFYTALAPTGRFDLDYDNIKIYNDDNDQRSIDLEGTIVLKNSSFKTTPAITDLTADIQTNILYKKDTGFQLANANITAKNLRIKGKSLTDLNAAINYYPDIQTFKVENLIADCHDGKIVGKLQYQLTDEKTWRYLIQTDLEHIDLHKFLLDTASGENNGNNYTTGNMCGSFSVTGQTGYPDSRIGMCKLMITDMEVGRLSPLAKLLNVLKLELGDFAFDQMLVDSYIKGDDLHFEKFDMAGNSLAFNGSGKMSLQDQNIDLLLTARGKRLATAEPGIWQSLSEGLSTAMVRMEITGNVYDPQIKTRKLPVINDTLELLGAPTDTK